MNDHELIQALRWLKVETGSLVCLGCVYEHHCSTHGCAVINEAVRRLKSLTMLEGRINDGKQKRDAETSY